MDHNGEGLTRSVTDAVTGAYPRALLEPRMAEELARAGRAAPLDLIIDQVLDLVPSAA
jgi:hypothetical protein